MPVHCWRRVHAGTYHHFHTNWITELGKWLNRGLLPGQYYALVEQTAGETGPDVLAKVSYHASLHEEDVHTRRRRTLAIRHVSGDSALLIAVLQAGAVAQVVC